MSHDQLSSAKPAKSSGSLVRSKSLRLPKKDRVEFAETPNTSSLTRHGSIRQPKPSPSNAAVTPSAGRANAGNGTGALNFIGRKTQPLSVFKRPFQKLRSGFIGDRDKTELAEKEGNKPGYATKFGSLEDVRHSPATKRSPFGRGQDISSSKCDLSDVSACRVSPTSVPSDGSHSPWAAEVAGIDLVAHLKRLTEEHEKLQVEYARLRLQVLEKSAVCYSAAARQRKENVASAASVPELGLATIPEDVMSEIGDVAEEDLGNQNETQELPACSHRNEVLRLQDELRRLQRKYWDVVLHSEGASAEVSEASRQVVELSDKLDEKQKEISRANSLLQKFQIEIISQNQEIQQCRDALQDYQVSLEETSFQRDLMKKKLKDLQAEMTEFQESAEFLQSERAMLAETLQETEQSLRLAKADMEQDRVVLKELTDRCRKLCAKVQDKGLQVRLLQAELDSTQGRARDLLLSQGAELSMAAVSLTQLSYRVHSILKSAAEFAATQLGLDREVLDEIMSDLEDSDGEPQVSVADLNDDLIDGVIPLPNGSLDSPPSLDNRDSSKHLEFRSLIEDKSAHSGDKSGGSTSPSLSLSSAKDPPRPTSFVQSIVRALEYPSKADKLNLNNSVQPISICSPIKSDEGFSNVVEPTLSLCKQPPLSNSSDMSNSANNSIKTTNSETDSEPSKKESTLPERTGDGPPPVPLKPVGMATRFRQVKKPPTISTVIQGQGDDLVPNGVQQKVFRQVEELSLGDDSSSCSNSSLQGLVIQVTAMLTKVVNVMNLMQDHYMTTIRSLGEENAQLKKEVSSLHVKEELLEGEVRTKGDIYERVSLKLSHLSDELDALRNDQLKEREKFMKQLAEMQEENQCLTAVNAEQAKQLREEVGKLVEGATNAAAMGYVVDSICDKLVFKQEIVKLKESLNSKEEMVKSVTAKFSRNKKVWEENCEKAETEVHRLDEVIEKALETLQMIPDVVNSSQPLRDLWILLGGPHISSNSSGGSLDGSQQGAAGDGFSISAYV